MKHKRYIVAVILLCLPFALALDRWKAPEGKTWNYGIETIERTTVESTEGNIQTSFETARNTAGTMLLNAHEGHPVLELRLQTRIHTNDPLVKMFLPGLEPEERQKPLEADASYKEPLMLLKLNERGRPLAVDPQDRFTGLNRIQYLMLFSLPEVEVDKEQGAQETIKIAYREGIVFEGLMTTRFEQNHTIGGVDCRQLRMQLKGDLKSEGGKVKESGTIAGETNLCFDPVAGRPIVATQILRLENRVDSRGFKSIKRFGTTELRTKLEWIPEKKGDPPPPQP